MSEDLLPTFNPTDQEIHCLREENIRLKQLLTLHGIPIPPPSPLAQLQTSAPKTAEVESGKERARQRIVFFRSLFRGREDVYAVRWQTADGRAGYSPSTLKNWKAINQSRPEERKKVDRETRTLLPLTDTVIEKHLRGQETIGIYPLLADETSWFLAVDFDKKSWHQDAIAFLETCRELRVPAALERSRSGNGGHVWIFFEQALSAITVRKLGCTILTRTMERRYEMGFDSYDRLFPNQDTMPKGGFGNLIALPLQFAPRKLGNSVFIDDRGIPYADQWQYLAGLQRMPIAMAAEIVEEAQRTGDLVGVRKNDTDSDEGAAPWSMLRSRKRAESPIDGPLPNSLRLIRSNLLYVEKKDAPPALLNRLLQLAAFQNPEFYKAQAMRLSTCLKPRVIACGEDFSRYIGIPRGCLTEVLSLLEHHNIRPDLQDERFNGVPIEVEFAGQLRPLQAEAAAEIGQYDEGVLCAPTAFGKTAVAAWLIAERKVNTLVLVHRQQLLEQWRERLAMFLRLPAKSIGHIGGGKMQRTGIVDVAMIQSLQRKGEVRDFVADYGQAIVDECHHVSAFTFEQILKQIRARFLAGLTATPIRKDGHHPIIYMQCGPIRFNITARAVAKCASFEQRVTPRYTEFRPSSELTDLTIQDMYAALAKDMARNEMIADDIVRALGQERCPLLLTGRIEHLKYFAGRLQNVANHVFVLKGGQGRRQRQLIAQALASVPPNESRVILATGSYIGEGFDDPRLDTLFLAMPVSWKGTLQQYVGRLNRLHQDKRFVQVYDYVDNLVPMLARMYQRRLKGYAAFGYVITA
jgi:superfamily II DNA or RNA helicase